MRTMSGAMPESAWSSAAMCMPARLRNSWRSRSAYWMCRPMARSGQSICSTIPALAIASYSCRIASAIANRDRRVAGRRLSPRAAGVAEHALLEAREVGKVLIHEGIAGAAEAREPVLDISGVAWLRHLAVIDKIDAGLDLLRHDLVHRRAHALGERDRIDRHAFLLGEHHADEIGRARQAAGVGDKEALG